MSHKPTAALLAAILALSLVFGLSACGSTCEHEWGEWTVVTQETCTENGSRERTCKLCNEKQTETIPAAHAWEEEWTIDVEPTATAEGEKSHHCSRCGERTDITPIEKIGETAGLIYELNADGQSYAVTGFDGNAQRERVMVVPQEHDGKPVTAIADSGLENLFAEEIYLPDTIESIGDEGLQGCDSVTELVLPASLKSLGYQALAECDKLASITLPEGLETIDEAQFWRDPIVSLTIPSTVEKIGESITLGCTELTDITVADGNENYYAEGNCLIEKSTNTLIAGGSGDIVIPAGVEIIGEYAFSETGITSVVFPDSITEIKDYAFNGCTELVSADIGGKILKNKWGNQVFTDCAKLSDITLREGIEYFGGEAFCNTAVEEIIFPDSFKTAMNAPFKGTPLKKITLGVNYQTTFNIASGCLEEIDASRSKNFTEVDGMLFRKNYLYMATAREKIVVPEQYTDKNGDKNDVTTIYDVFENMQAVKEIVLPKTLTRIDQHALQNCSNLEKLTLQSVVRVDTMDYLGIDWLLGCNNLRELHLPEGITFEAWGEEKRILFGRYVSYDELALTDIYFGGTVAQWEETTKDCNVPPCTVHCSDGNVTE